MMARKMFINDCLSIFRVRPDGEIFQIIRGDWDKPAFFIFDAPQLLPIRHFADKMRAPISTAKR